MLEMALQLIHFVGIKRLQYIIMRMVIRAMVAEFQYIYMSLMRGLMVILMVLKLITSITTERTIAQII